MTTQRNFVCGILILAIGVLKKNIVFVRSVCLQDVLSFYNNKEVACSFRKDDFKRIFFDNSKECQINCSINSTKPRYSDLGDSEYEIINMKIRFTSTAYKFPLKPLCSNGTIKNFNIDLDCEGEYLHDRGIGERCVSVSQCVSVNVNSTCNETTGLCQCKTGHQCLLRTNTRLTDERIDNSPLLFGVGTVGFVLGVAICGLLYFIMILYSNRYQASRSENRREDFTETGSVLVSQTSTPHPNYNQTQSNDFKGNSVYNHLHGDPIEVFVEPDYDHVPFEENDDYSHITTRNAQSIDIPGEYEMIS